VRRKGLHPTEDLLDALSLALADLVASMVRGPSVQARGVAALDSRDVRSDLLVAQMRDELFDVIALVGSKRRGLDSLARLAREQILRHLGFGLERRADLDVQAQAITVLHEGMAAVAKLRLLAFAASLELGLRVSLGRVRIVRAALAAEVDHALIIGPTARWRFILAPQALGGRGPCFDQHPIHREVLIGQEHAAARFTTDEEAKLARKGNGKEAKLSYGEHALMENRNGLCVDLKVCSALKTETEAAKEMLARQRRKRVRPASLGGDKGYHTKDFVAHLRGKKIAPHIAQIEGRRTPGLARRATQATRSASASANASKRSSAG
jgi:hypothetical protein